jgi:hypothetical protein
MHRQRGAGRDPEAAIGHRALGGYGTRRRSRPAEGDQKEEQIRGARSLRRTPAKAMQSGGRGNHRRCDQGERVERETESGEETGEKGEEGEDQRMKQVDHGW